MEGRITSVPCNRSVHVSTRPGFHHYIVGLAHSRSKIGDRRSAGVGSGAEGAAGTDGVGRVGAAAVTRHSYRGGS